MVDIVQVAPKRAVLDAAAHTKVGLFTGWSDNPSTTSQSISAFGARRGSGAALNSRVCARHGAVETAMHHNMQRDRRRRSAVSGGGGGLLVDDQSHPLKLDHLVELSCDLDGNSIHGQPLNLSIRGKRKARRRERSARFAADQLSRHQVLRSIGGHEHQLQVLHRSFG